MAVKVKSSDLEKWEMALTHGYTHWSHDRKEWFPIARKVEAIKAASAYNLTVWNPTIVAEPYPALQLITNEGALYRFYLK